MLDLTFGRTIHIAIRRSPDPSNRTHQLDRKYIRRRGSIAPFSKQLSNKQSNSKERERETNQLKLILSDGHIARGEDPTESFGQIIRVCTQRPCRSLSVDIRISLARSLTSR